MTGGDGFVRFYRQTVTYVPRMDGRLRCLAAAALGERPRRLLDLGSGDGVLLEWLAEAGLTGLVGYDARPPAAARGWLPVVGDLACPLPFSDRAFDVVVAGEVIEHVPYPDHLLREIRRVLTPSGLLALSTPNLVAWANRILVPLGIQPLFTETSSEVHLGRRLRVLGQGNPVQGHLKVFSRRALAEVLVRCGFVAEQWFGMPGEFPPPADRVDRFFARFPGLASDVVVLARPTR